jgi:hypothetical protein
MGAGRLVPALSRVGSAVVFALPQAAHVLFLRPRHRAKNNPLEV